MEEKKKWKGQSDCWTENVHSPSGLPLLLSLHFALFLGILLIVYLLFCSTSLNLFWESLFCVISQMPSCLLSDVLNAKVNSLPILHLCPPRPQILSLSHCLANPSSWASCPHARTCTHVLMCGISMTTSMWNPFPFEQFSSDLHFICMICKQPVAFDSGNGE